MMIKILNDKDYHEYDRGDDGGGNKDDDDEKIYKMKIVTLIMMSLITPRIITMKMMKLTCVLMPLRGRLSRSLIE